LREPDDRGDPVTPTSDEPRGVQTGVEDRQLADACRAGDLAAFEQLFTAHGAGLKRVAMNILGNVTDAEDAVQETFMKVYRSMAGFRGQSSFATWVYCVLLNCCYDVRRRRARQQEQEMPDPQTEEPEAREREIGAVAAGDHPLRLALESCVARLAARQREVFLLFEVEGFRHSEISVMLKISEASSKNLLYEAKQHLRRLLSESGPRAGDKA
jgi:RNA polymerase sigma-70 factor (ECF subfamily)